VAWTTPLTAVASTALTAAQWNASVRDNLLETAPAKFTAAGQMFVSTAANAGAARTPSTATVATSETQTSTSYVALATAGPTVSSLTTGTQALVAMSAQMGNGTSGQNNFVGVAVSGASSVAAADTISLRYQSFGANARHRASTVHLLTGLTAGSNTFSLQYRVDAGTGTWLDRNIVVVPL
jgi:6,7-dimethyl-8-ribityllumazine synthase